MAQILVRDLEQETIDRLKAQAKARGRSLQAEAKRILEDGAKPDMEIARAMIDEIRNRLSGKQLGDSVDLLRESRY